MKLYVIPNIYELEKWCKLSSDYNLGFEYNDFFNTNILDNKYLLDERIEAYASLGRNGDTLHGVFFDINFDSVDSKIKEISMMRARQVLDIARILKCKAVIFHTNYQTWIKDKTYKEKWVNSNAQVYKTLLDEYRDISIYVENMFDNDPNLLARLASEIKGENRFGVCLDVAHAHISNVSLDVWFEKLSPYIKHIHLNDNDGVYDLHGYLSSGNLDYKYVLDKVNEIGNDKEITILLEMNKYEDVVKSLSIIGGGGYGFK